MDEILISDKQKNKDIEGFCKAHKKAAISYCKKHDIDITKIRACIEDKSDHIYYEYNGKVFLTASLTYIPKVKLKFKNQ